MPNIAQALKAEIIRISRKEIKAAVTPLRSSNTGLKKVIAELKGKIAVLESDNKRLLAFQKTAEKGRSQVSPEVMEKVRITSKRIKALRTKLGLSQEEFAMLLGVSSQAVYAMEHKEGGFKMRTSTLSNFLLARKMGKREAKKRLEEIND